ncbi:unnamed protein product [Symbiodinium sp. KB8]|nr:unnamed protein product [Symbiodinium sp. KB8]
MGRGQRGGGGGQWSGDGKSWHYWAGAFSPPWRRESTNQPQPRKHGQAAFPSYSGINLPAAPSQPRVRQEEEGGLNSVQSALNAARKAESRVAKLHAAHETANLQWTEYEKQAKASFQKERKRYLQDLEKIERDALEAEEAQAAARLRVREVVLGERRAIAAARTGPASEEQVSAIFEEWASEEGQDMDGVLQRALHSAVSSAAPLRSPLRATTAAPRSPARRSSVSATPGSAVPAQVDPYTVPLGAAASTHGPTPGGGAVGVGEPPGLSPGPMTRHPGQRDASVPRVPTSEAPPRPAIKEDTKHKPALNVHASLADKLQGRREAMKKAEAARQAMISREAEECGDAEQIVQEERRLASIQRIHDDDMSEDDLSPEGVMAANASLQAVLGQQMLGNDCCSWQCQSLLALSRRIASRLGMVWVLRCRREGLFGAAGPPVHAVAYAVGCAQVDAEDRCLEGEELWEYSRCQSLGRSQLTSIMGMSLLPLQFEEASDYRSDDSEGASAADEDSLSPPRPWAGPSPGDPADVIANFLSVEVAAAPRMCKQPDCADVRAARHEDRPAGGLAAMLRGANGRWDPVMPVDVDAYAGHLFGSSDTWHNPWANIMVLVFSPDRVPDVLNLPVHIPATTAELLEAVEECRDEEHARWFPTVRFADPQPARHFVAAVAFPEWTAKVFVLIDSRLVNAGLFCVAIDRTAHRESILAHAGFKMNDDVDVYCQNLGWALEPWQVADLATGDLLSLVPRRRGAPQRFQLMRMLHSIDFWDAQADLPRPPGDHVLLMTEGVLQVFQVFPARRAQIQKDIAALLGSEADRLTLRMPSPKPKDVCRLGYFIHTVTVATERLCRLPVPPARIAPKPYILAFDCRPILQAFRWRLCASQQVRCADLTGEFQDAMPVGWTVDFLGAPIVRIDGDDFLCIEHGLLVTVVPCRVRSSAPNHSSSSGSSVSTSQAEVPSEDASEAPDGEADRERSRSPRREVSPRRSDGEPGRVGQADGLRRTAAVGIGAVLPFAGGAIGRRLLTWMYMCRAGFMHVAPWLWSSWRLTPVIASWFRANGVPQFCRDAVRLLRSSAGRPRLNLAQRISRGLARPRGWQIWAPIPDAGPDVRIEEGAQPSDTDEAEAAGSPSLTICVLTPEFEPEVVRARLTAGATQDDVLWALRRRRMDFRGRVFPMVVLPTCQAAQGWLIALAVPSWAIVDTFAYFDLRAVDGRLFAECVPSTIDRLRILRFAGLDEDGEWDVFAGDAPNPLEGLQEVAVLTGTLLTVLPRHSHRSQVPTVFEVLDGPAHWEVHPDIPHGQGRNVCAVLDQGHRRISRVGVQSTLTEIFESLSLRADSARICHAHPLARDVTIKGFACQEVLAVIQPDDAGTENVFVGPACIFDCRGLLQGWLLWPFTGIGPCCADVRDLLEMFMPPSWELYIEGASRVQNGCWPAVDGQIFWASFIPADIGYEPVAEMQEDGDQPDDSSERSADASPAPAGVLEGTARRPYAVSSPPGETRCVATFVLTRSRAWPDVLLEHFANDMSLVNSDMCESGHANTGLVCALWWASVVALQLPVCGPIIFRADNVAALRGVQGCDAMTEAPVCVAARAFHFSVGTRPSQQVSYVHVHGHQGDPANELADAVANLGAQGEMSSSPCRLETEFWLRDNALAARWLPHVMLSLAHPSQLPPLRQDVFTWNMQQPEARLSAAQIMRPFTRFVTYNAVSLLDPGETATGRLEVSVAGLQETRPPAFGGGLSQPGFAELPLVAADGFSLSMVIVGSDCQSWVPATFAQHMEGPGGTLLQKLNNELQRSDYVGIPIGWSQWSVKSWVEPEVTSGHAAPDHFASVVECHFAWAGGSRRLPPVRIDPAALLDAGNHAKVEGILQAAPPVSWDTNVSDHASILAEYLYSSLAEAFPLKARRMRLSFLSAETSTLRAHAAALRHALRGRLEALRLARLRCAFLVWRSPDGCYDRLFQGRWLQQLCHVIAALSDRISVVGKRLRRFCRADKRRHVDGLADQLGQAPQGEVHIVLKRLLRPKKFRRRGPAPLPKLKTTDGSMCTTQEQVVETWRKHFSDLEGGVQVSAQELVEFGLDSQRQTGAIERLQASDVPDLVKLAATFRDVNPQKACGPDMIPPSLCRGFASQMSVLFYPVLLKTLAYISAPALLIGGRKGLSYTMGFFCARSFLDFTRRKQIPAAILFSDISAAYYSVVRELLTGGKLQGASLEELAASLSLSNEDLQFMQSVLAEEPVLAGAGSQDLLAALTRELHSGTWFLMQQDDQLVRTRRGTRPGSSLADVLYALLFIQVLRRRGNFSDLGLRPIVPWSGARDLAPFDGRVAGTTSVEVQDLIYADDLATCIIAATAGALPQAIQDVASQSFDTLAGHGLRSNIGPKKTAALMSVVGAGSREVRRAVFTEGRGRVPVLRERGPGVWLDIVSQYRHLGSVIAHDGSLVPEIKAKLQAARTCFHEGKAKVFCAPCVALERRVRLFRVHVLSTLFAGAGAWPLLCKTSWRLLETGLYNMIRQLLRLKPEQDQRWTHQQMLAAVGLPSLEGFLALERLRFLAQLSRGGPDAAFALLQQSPRAQGAFKEAEQWLLQAVGATGAPGTFSDKWPAWEALFAQVGRWKGLLKRAESWHIGSIQAKARFQRFVRDHWERLPSPVVEVPDATLGRLMLRVSMDIDRNPEGVPGTTLREESGLRHCPLSTGLLDLRSGIAVSLSFGFSAQLCGELAEWLDKQVHLSPEPCALLVRFHP